MGQSEVIKLLEKEKEWKTAKEIANDLNADNRVVGRVLLVLSKHKEVSKRRCKNSTTFKYIYKIIKTKHF